MSTSNYVALEPLGYQAISATSATAVGVTVSAASAASATISQPNFALFVCETNAARWRDDGTAPTATTGTPIAVGQSLQYDGQLRQIQFISQAGSTTIHANLYSAN